MLPGLGEPTEAVAINDRGTVFGHSITPADDTIFYSRRTPVVWRPNA